MNDLQGKTAVITGGNSGMGYAAAKKFSDLGANVVITGRNKEALGQASETLGVTGIVADQANLQDIDELVSRLKRARVVLMCYLLMRAWQHLHQLNIWQKSNSITL